MRVIFQYQVFKNDSNGYTVSKYKDLNTNKTVTCTGINLPDVKIPYDFTVEEVQDKKYGIQYKVISFTEDVSNTETDVVEYLSSRLFSGIGKAMAKRIYDMYGDKTLEIIDKYPGELLKVKGISQGKLDKIISSYKENHKYRDAMAFFTPFGFSATQIVKLCDALGNTSICDRVRANPYIICDVKGFNFDCAERFREKFGIQANNRDRIHAAAIEVIKRGFISGLVSVTRDQLLYGMNKLLKLRENRETYIYLWDCVKTMIKQFDLSYKKVKDGDNVILRFYLPRTLINEDLLAELISKCAQKQPVPINIDVLIAKCSKIELDDTQCRAIRGVFSNTLSVVTGGAGVGKTTTIQTVSDIYKELYPKNEQIFLAPTGRAARRITESTGKRAYTIHSYLNLVSLDDSDIAYTSEEVTIDNSLVVIDEFSMVDMNIAVSLFSALRQGNTVVIVGDPEQLMSVGIGSVLCDIIKSGVIPVNALTVEHRQKEGSVLISNANKIRRGDTGVLSGADFSIIPVRDDYTEDAAKELEDAMVDAVVKEVEKYGIDEVVCLSPYKKYTAGVISLNKRLQEILNPVNDEYYSMKGANDTYFRPGDIVMHLVNDYENNVMNGDVGRVIGIDKEDNDFVMYVQYIDEKGHENIMEYRRKNVDDLQLAYACTVHKAQGSEYKSVVTCCTNIHKYAKRKNLLYTAVTRAKEHVVLFGNISCIAETIQNDVIDDRNTLLDFDLRQLCEKEEEKDDWVQFPADVNEPEPFEQLKLPI